MLNGRSLCVVIPAYNTRERVLRVIETLPSVVDAAVVIDDASTDETPGHLATLSDPRCTVLRHPVNRGVGGAIATGYEHARERGYDLAAVMAGDGQMHPDDLVPLATPVAEDRADYSKGNRLLWPGCARVMPPSRYVGNRGLSWLTRHATGLGHVGDSQCGYTVISRRVLERTDLARMWPRYGYPNHLLGALGDAGYRVVDVPVRPVYAGENSGVRLRDAVVTVPRILAAIALGRKRAVRGEAVLGVTLGLCAGAP